MCLNKVISLSMSCIVIMYISFYMYNGDLSAINYLLLTLLLYMSYTI